MLNELFVEGNRPIEDAIAAYYPKSCRLRLIFSYAGSPGFRSFLGLYFAGFSRSMGMVCMLRFVFMAPPLRF